MLNLKTQVAIFKNPSRFVISLFRPELMRNIAVKRCERHNWLMIRKIEHAIPDRQTQRDCLARIDVLLVDDHDLFRAGMRLILGDEPLGGGMQVGQVHEAAWS